jgi:hypothetical protein
MPRPATVGVLLTARQASLSLAELPLDYSHRVIAHEPRLDPLTDAS